MLSHQEDGPLVIPSEQRAFLRPLLHSDTCKDGPSKLGPPSGEPRPGRVWRIVPLQGRPAGTVIRYQGTQVVGDHGGVAAARPTDGCPCDLHATIHGRTCAPYVPRTGTLRGCGNWSWLAVPWKRLPRVQSGSLRRPLVARVGASTAAGDGGSRPRTRESWSCCIVGIGSAGVGIGEELGEELGARSLPDESTREGQQESDGQEG